ncbi:MAG: MFS transporter [Neorhizobium sp.]|nr:MFS transporter [Neorhizobium sp.]
MTPASTPAANPAKTRWRMLGMLCLAVVLSFTTWFSTTAIAPDLKSAWQLSDATLGWLTNAVQIGFVLGALSASLVNLPDIVRLNRLMAGSALVAAIANAVLLFEPSVDIAIAARLATGMALAGVYPPALKLVATWFVTRRGLALSGVIGAITAGSALPHLLRAVIFSAGTGAPQAAAQSSAASGLDWHLVILMSSAATLIGAVMFLVFTREGPHPFGKAVFNPREIGVVLRDRALVLVTLGYLGHMWELYAMWAWLLAYLSQALQTGSNLDGADASILTFLAVAAGVAGCFLGGLLSDRFGRTATTAGMMIVSATCAALIGVVFDGPFLLLALVVIVWGIAIIGDSAQFSAAATELADRHYVGTALSLQMGLGFGLTILIIWLMPHLASAFGGWRWTFSVLAVGPVIGTGAMLILRRLPEAARLAGGRR